MNFLKLNRKPKQRFFLPDKHIEEVLVLVDRKSLYRVWKKLQKIYPDLDFKKDPYSFHVKRSEQRFFVPDKHIEEVLVLADRKTNVGLYQLWKRLQEIFPDLNFKKDPYIFHVKKILTPYVIRDKK